MSGQASPPADYPGRKQIGRLLGRYQALGEQRLTRIRDSLNHEQESFFNLLPLLLHTNHPALPGYAGDSVPAGIAGYIPDRNALLLAHRYSPEVKGNQPAQRLPPLSALYLIGSSGTVGQDRHSDFDFWVCHHPSLDADALEALQRKLSKLEAIAEQLMLQVHFFLLHAEGFRDGAHAQLSRESSGSTQHHLLLEEFYRSGLLIAGHPPLWWLVPTQQQANYREWTDHLIEHRFINPNEWLDFGGLQQASAHEFFTAAHWQLYKGIELPYKSLLKLVLFESYAASYPDIDWLCDQIKQHTHGEHTLSADQIDAYRLIMQRIEQHLLKQQQPERLQLMRRAFYFKSGVRLSQKNPPDNWKYRLMSELAAHWGWQRGELLNLDARQQWKIARVIEERDQLVAELSHSYRLLTQFAKQHDAVPEDDHTELAVLGRKLYAALERRPGKIDHINPGISQDLSEETLWLRRIEDRWQMTLSPPEPGVTVQHASLGLVEMLVWLCTNGIVAGHTRVDLPEQLDTPHTELYLKLLKDLRTRLPNMQRRNRPMRDFQQPAHAESLIVYINAEQDPTQGQVQLIQEHEDPLNLAQRTQPLLQQLDLVMANSWGELLVERHRSDAALPEMLCSLLEAVEQAPVPTPIEAVCHTTSYGPVLARRLTRVVDDLQQHFRRHQGAARYLLQTHGQFHLVERREQTYKHVPIGQQRDLLDFLGEPQTGFFATDVDPDVLRDSPLPFLLRLNRPDWVQLCYRVQTRGISLFVFDEQGNLHEQWLPGAKENFFLQQQQRFYDTLQTWRPRIAANQQTQNLQIQFLRISQVNGHWQARPPGKLPPANQSHVELFLSTGRRGPQADGFSLISGTREFNSATLGADLYSEVAQFMISKRRAEERYPIYLTGVLIADEQRGDPIPLVELLHLKARIERQLALALQNLD